MAEPPPLLFDIEKSGIDKTFIIIIITNLHNHRLRYERGWCEDREEQRGGGIRIKIIIRSLREYRFNHR